jgi:hypothetical protein
MMEAAYVRLSAHLSAFGRLDLARLGGVLVQGAMRATGMVIVEVA